MEDGDPGSVEFSEEVKINNAEELRALNESELYFSLFKNENLGIDLIDRLLRGTNARGRYAQSRLTVYQRDWPDVGVQEADIKEFIRTRFVTDLFGAGPMSEKFSKEWFGHGAQGKILENTIFYKFCRLNALYRTHTVEEEKSHRWIREFRKYRYCPVWCESFLHDAIRIGNKVKPPSRRQSIDETIEMGSSIYASDIYQYIKGKRHDWGLKIIKSCGSSREVLGKEYAQLSREDHEFIGAGWCHAAVVEYGAKYRTYNTFEYFLQGYAIFWKLIFGFYWFTGKGYCFFLDGFFTRNPVQLLERAKELGLNVSGTCRNDARNLPADHKRLREYMKDQEEGSFVTFYSSTHGVSYFMNKGRKIFHYLSNWHSTTEQDQLRRRLKDGGDWVEREVDVSISVADHNKGGFPNVDAGDGTISKAGLHHRKSTHWWRVLVDAVIFHIIPLHAWLLWRILHPEHKPTCRQFLLKIAETPISGATFMRRKTKPKNAIVPVSLLGKRRFSELPICELTPSMIRAEMGPRKYDIDILAAARASTFLKRAQKCMDYRPSPWRTRGRCCLEGCDKRVKIRCLGCGAFGCFQVEKCHISEIHERFQKAIIKMKRSL